MKIQTLARIVVVVCLAMQAIGLSLLLIASAQSYPVWFRCLVVGYMAVSILLAVLVVREAQQRKGA